jgi:Guanine nucleotide exchange factor synembryn
MSHNAHFSCQNAVYLATLRAKRPVPSPNKQPQQATFTPANTKVRNEFYLALRTTETMAKELLVRLSSILSVEADQRLERLVAWNAEMEACLLAHRQLQQPSVCNTPEGDLENCNDLMSKVSCSLHSTLLGVLQGQSLDQVVGERLRDNDATNSCVDSRVVEALQHWKNDSDAATSEVVQWQDLCEILRGSQNWLRWYLQIYLQQPRRQPVRELLQLWKTRAMLELYILLLEELVRRVHPAGARYASQFFFYATFPMTATAPHDQALNDAYAYLVDECSIMKRLLRLLLVLRQSELALTLSLVRNVHNALVSFPQQSTKAVENAKVDTSELSNDVATWVPAGEIISYKVAFRELARFVLLAMDSDKVPATVDDDRQAELVVEILRCCYALRVGTDLIENEEWQRLISLLLKLDSQKEQYYECQLAAISLLMDASPEYSQHLSRDSTGTLLCILERQVTTVWNEQYVDDRAATALTPILAVLHKFCVASPDFLQLIRDGIFPDEDGYMNAVAREEERTGSKQATNMSPLDTPKGSLRWKLIRLLTWPQGFVKRLAGELLFVLCHSQQAEFVRRVGMGNAIPLLGLKGLVQLPPSVQL